MVDWEADLAEAQARLATLDAARDTAAALAVQHEWWATDPYRLFFSPLPVVARDDVDVDGEWLEAGEARVAFDVHDRPIAYLHGDEPRLLWFWDDDGSFLEIDLDEPVVRRARATDGTVVRVMSARAGGEMILWLTWAGEQAVRADRASVTGDHGWAMAQVAEHNAAGALLQIRRGAEQGPADLGDCLQLAGTLTPARVTWDARVDAAETWPGTEAMLERAAPLADALDRAVRDAVAAAGATDLFVLEVHTKHDQRSLLPPLVRMADVGWRDQMRRTSRQDGAALFDLHKARELGLAVDVRLADHLDAEALQTCRMLSAAHRPRGGWELLGAAHEVLDTVSVRLAQRLNAEPIPGTVEPFVAFVALGGGGDRDRHTRAAIGDARMDAFMASLASTKPRGGATPARTALERRDALDAFARERGLDAHAARIAHELAEPGFLLEEAEGVRSRLGGPPLLPDGEPWPERLTFVAAIDLSELPPSRLPDHGWLLGFIGFDLEDDDGLIDEADNAPGSPARLFWTDAPVPASGPSLRERRVRPREVLTLPDDESAAELLGLDAYDRISYEELERELSDAVTPDWTRHWIGGHVTGAQGYDMLPGTVILLSLTYDEALDFEFLDGGTAQFRITPEALAARDFSRVTAVADSS